MDWSNPPLREHDYNSKSLDESSFRIPVSSPVINLIRCRCGSSLGLRLGSEDSICVRRRSFRRISWQLAVNPKRWTRASAVEETAVRGKFQRVNFHRLIKESLCPTGDLH